MLRALRKKVEVGHVLALELKEPLLLSDLPRLTAKTTLA
jgi:hypothetical protein